MPFIPKEHEKYNLLPWSSKNGGECFVYPGGLVDTISEKLSKFGDISLIPYDHERFTCYQDYFDFIEELDQKYNQKVPGLHKNLERLKNYINENNDKSVWSVCRYIGPDIYEVSGLTKGQCYYWPTSIENPEYNGVIDDEEFTNYMYDTDPKNWEILEDPTGMAKKVLENGSIRNYMPTTEDLVTLSDTNGGKRE